MRRVIVCISIFLFGATMLSWAQEEKLRVAVFDPSVSGKAFDEGTGIAVRELVSSALVNTGKYTIIERSLLSKILEEQKMSNSGVVDDRQAIELGKVAGANKVVLIVLSSAGARGMISLKMIDVKSASIDMQKTKVVNQLSDVVDIATPLALEVIGEKASATPPIISDNHNNGTKIDNSTKPTTPIQIGDIILEFAGYKSKSNANATIYVDGAEIGRGTLHEGFNVSFNDRRPGKHEVKIEWSNSIPSKTFKINTESKKRFVFEYGKTGFGYDFLMK